MGLENPFVSPDLQSTTNFAKLLMLQTFDIKLEF